MIDLNADIVGGDSEILARSFQAKLAAMRERHTKDGLIFSHPDDPTLEDGIAEVDRLLGIIEGLPCINRWTYGWTCDQLLCANSLVEKVNPCANCKAKQEAKK